MKKYMIFAISFIILFTVFQIVSGYVLTLSYTPNIDEAWSHAGSLSTGIIKGPSFFMSLFFAFLIASLAYITPKMFRRERS